MGARAAGETNAPRDARRTQEEPVDGLTCTAPDCLCQSVRDLAPSIGPMSNDQQHTDYIVFPLLAGTLARCLVATHENVARHDASTEPAEPGIVSHARIILTLAHASAEGVNWERDRESIATIVSFVMAAWEVFALWVPLHYVPNVSGWDGATTAGLLGAARAWVDRAKPRSLTELVLFTVDIANRTGLRGRELPVSTRAMRPLRVELAARLRNSGLTTWPRVLEAVVNDWQTTTLEGLLLEYASTRTIITLGIPANVDDELEDRDSPAGATAGEASTPSAAPVGAGNETHAGADAVLAEAFAAIDRSEAGRRAAEAERLRLADRCAGLQGHVERLEAELEASRVAINRLDLDRTMLERERDELTDRLVAEEALAGERPSPSANAFAGRTVYVFTGLASGDARAEMISRFSEFSPAGVTVYGIDSHRGPDAYPPDSIVVLDVSFMGHSASEYVLGRARSSGAWIFRGSYGPGRLAKAAAAAYAARCERNGAR